jgi:predicted Fe-Mo cluster-binding NifX family protein
VKICVPCQFPGGPDGVVAAPFEDSELLDYYEITEDGNFEHIAQTRPCFGGCSDPIESVTRRGVESIIVAGISPNSLMRFANAGVKVYRTDPGQVMSIIDSFISGTLEVIGMDQFAKLGKEK